MKQGSALNVSNYTSLQKSRRRAAVIPVMVNVTLTLWLHSNAPQWIGLGASVELLAGLAVPFAMAHAGRRRWLETEVGHVAPRRWLLEAESILRLHWRTAQAGHILCLLVIIYLHDKRRQLAAWLPKIQHLVGGMPLLLSGVQKLGDETERPMAIVEIAVASIVLAAFIRELHAEIRAHGRPVHSPFGWFDLAAGGLLIFEAFHGAHTKPGYMRPPFLSGVLTIALGLFHVRFHEFIARRRYLKIDEDGLEFRVARVRRLVLSWQDLDSVDLAGSHAAFYRTDGRCHKVRLNLFHNQDEVRQGITDQARAAGVPTESRAADA